MKFKTSGCLLLGLALVLTLSVSARPDGRGKRAPKNAGSNQECVVSAHHENNKATPVSIDGVISIPGLPLTSTDIAWVDPGTEGYYLADRSNGGVDIIDAENDVYVGRVTGFVGNPPAPNTGGGTATTNGPGPNGVLVTPNKRLWAGDGNSLAQVADVDPTSSSYLQLLKAGGISTAWNNPLIPADTCDGGTMTTHYCGRADELAYDTKDHIIMIANNAPLSLAAAGKAAIDPYATFINADTFMVLGHISFVGAGGLEQPIWDPEKQRFLVTVPGKLNTTVTPNTVITAPSIQVINPKTMLSEVTYPLDCFAITAGTTTNNSAAGVGITGIALAPYQHFLVSACGFPIILTLNPSKVIPNPNGTINVLNVVYEVGGGDEVWFNPGDDRYYVTGPFDGITGNVQQLGVIDAEDSGWLQDVPEVVPIPGGVVTTGKNPAAFPEANRIFSVQQITVPVATSTGSMNPDDSVCAKYNVNRMGCIAVFTHESEGEEGQ